MENHEIAQCYPPLSEEEFQALKAHIAANSLQNPIVLYEDKILDGTQRARACAELGIEPSYITPKIDDPFEYVIGQNERRRQLSTSQLALVAEEMANLKHGSNRHAKKLDTPRGVSSGLRDIAKRIGVGKSSVERVRYAKDHGISELLPAIKSGTLSAATADKIAHLPKQEQPKAFEAAIAKGPKKKVAAETKEPSLSKPTQPHPNARMSPAMIAEYEAMTKTESIYPEGLPFPVHPRPGLNAHLHEAFVDLKATEPLIPQMNRRKLYDEVWVYTQRIQTFAPGFGKDAYIIKDIDPRWVEWARNVARKVRAQEALLIEKQQTQGSIAAAISQEKKAPRLQLADAFEKRMNNWRRLIKRALDEIHFAQEEEVRVFQATEHILINHFEERRAHSARRAPSKIGETNQIASSAQADSATVNGSPSLEGEQ